MDSLVLGPTVSHFMSPKDSLGEIDADSVGRLLAAASDVALIIDEQGIIRDAAFGNEDLLKDAGTKWLGKSWVDTVTPECRSKIESIRQEASSKSSSRWREVNHAVPRGGDVPVRYSAVQLDKGGRLIAFGRDMRNVAALQQKLVKTQLEMEREYERLRHAETRYRLLFQLASEAVLIVNGSTLRVAEANPAAARLLGVAAAKLEGRRVAELFARGSAVAVQQMLAGTLAGGRSERLEARLAAGETDVFVAASLFRQDETAYLLVRLMPAEAEQAAAARSPFLEVIRRLPDGFVVADQERRILDANPAFLDLAQVVALEHVRGEPLDRWFDRPGVDLNVLMANLREHGTVRRFATVLRGEYGATADVEIAAVAVPSKPEPVYGFSMRHVRAPLRAFGGVDGLPQSVEQLTTLIGHMSLKDVVRETTDVIERLCIEAALELTGDNRASAAQMLGLSRQSLYAKLRRYGLGDLDADENGKPYGNSQD